MSRTVRMLTLVFWLLLAGSLILAIGLASWQPDANQAMLVWIMAGYLLLSMILLPAALIIIHRTSLTHWWVWALLICLWVASGIVGQNSTLMSGIALAGNLVFLGSWIALLVAVGILLFQRDIALPLLGFLSLALVWTAAITWMIRGDLIAELLGALLGTPGAGRSLFWFAVLSNTTFCLLPLAAVSFIWQTIRAIKREIRGDISGGTSTHKHEE